MRHDEPPAAPLSLSSPDIDESDIRAVVEVLRSGRLALGPRAEEFERVLAARVGARYAVATSSGTTALHLIVRTLGLGPGDEVILPSFTFAATLNALLYEGVTPIFAEIERDHFCLCPDDAEGRITPRTRAIVAVDVFGHPAAWPRLTELAGRHRLALIDDACEALGASHGGVPVGSFGDAAAFAFYPNKPITTGEGGMIVTDREELAIAAQSLRNHGRRRTSAVLTHERLGYNYRLDEMSAALGLSQIARLDEKIAARERIADRYSAQLGDVAGIETPSPDPACSISWFAYVVLLAPETDRDRVIATMESRGVPVRTYFPPLHREPYVQRRLAGPVALPITESIAARTLALPFHPGLTDGDIDRVVTTLRSAVDEGMRR